MPKKLVKLDHGDPTINRIQRHVEDAFASVHQSLSSASLVTTVTSSLDERFDVRYLLTSSATPQTVTSSFQISGSVAVTGSVNISSSLVVAGNTIMSGTGAVRRFGVGMLADANIPLCVSSSNFTGIYLLASGTRCALELDARTVGSQSVVQFDEAGAQKFLIGKQTDNTFILYDATRNKNPFAYAPSTNVLTLQNADGRVGIGTGAPSANLEVSSGSISGSVGVRVANTSATASSAYLNLSTGNRAFTITSDANGNLAFNDDTAGVNRAFLRGSDGMFLFSYAAYVAGNLGVGVTPTQKLHVLGDALVSHGVDNGSAFLQIYNSSSVSPTSYVDLNTGIRSYKVSNQSGFFGVEDATASAFRMKMDTSGRFGFGASNPSVFMHIQGDTLIAGTASIQAASPFLAIKSTTPAASFPATYLELSSALKTWRIYGNGSSEFGIYDATPGVGTYRLKIDSAGRTGIGMTPATIDTFSVNGTMQSFGYRCTQGTAGASYGNVFNTWWTGAALQAWVDTTNVGTISLTSDRRLKQMIRTLTGSALNLVSQLRPVTYRWNDVNIWRDDGKDHLGFVADELQKVIPSAVNGLPSGSDFQSLNYGDIIAVQAKSIQELSASNASMAAQIISLQASLAALSGTVISLLKPIKP